MNRLAVGLMSLAVSLSVMAQNNTNSPYSQFGLGELSDQSVGFNKALYGTGMAIRNGRDVNPQNPASYSAVDSLTMLFDVGLSGQLTNFSERGSKVNARNAGFDYAVAQFRVLRHVGVGVGVLPYSSIGYKYVSTIDLANGESQDKVYGTYSGSGGLHEVYLGAGWEVVKGFSLGFNAGYLWGDLDRRIVTSSTASINTLSKLYTASVASYKLDFGAQFDVPLGKNDALTVGLGYGLGHKLGSDPECMVINTNATISKADTTLMTIGNGLSLPTSLSAGVSYRHGNVLTIAADARLDKWGSVDFPNYADGEYALKSGLLKDSYKFSGGLEWTPKAMSRNLFHRIRYRIGGGYSTSYFKVGHKDGPQLIGASAGFGIPITNGYNNRSYLNISAQWQHALAVNMITENTFRINIGLTFNERWFAKWKVE